MRAWISAFLPAPLTTVVFSFSIITFLARPSMFSVTFSSLMPRSSEMAVPPVRIAISCSMALRRSPNPGALTAATFSPPRSLLTTSVASASPSTSSAIMSKDRVDDAMHATRAAVEEGILPGGGVALLRAIKALSRLRPENDDQRTGVDIVKKALSTPARQIAINAGEDGSVVVGKILEKDTYAYGYDAQSGEFGNLVSKGIIDPTKVVRIALQDASSIAGLLITTEAMVAELPKKETAPAMPHGGGMGGMDY